MIANCKHHETKQLYPNLEIRAASDIGQNSILKKGTTNFTTPYSNPFLVLCIEIKLCIIFHKTG